MKLLYQIDVRNKTKMSLFSKTHCELDTDSIEDIFLSMFEATVMVWFSNKIMYIDILGNTPKLDEFKEQIYQGNAEPLQFGKNSLVFQITFNG